MQVIEDTRPSLEADNITWSHDRVRDGQTKICDEEKKLRRLEEEKKPGLTKQGRKALEQVATIQKIRATLLKCDVNHPQSFVALATLLHENAKRFAEEGELALEEMRCAGEELLSSLPEQRDVQQRNGNGPHHEQDDRLIHEGVVLWRVARETEVVVQIAPRDTRGVIEAEGFTEARPQDSSRLAREQGEREHEYKR